MSKVVMPASTCHCARDSTESTDGRIVGSPLHFFFGGHRSVPMGDCSVCFETAYNRWPVDNCQHPIRMREWPFGAEIAIALATLAMRFASAVHLVGIPKVIGAPL